MNAGKTIVVLFACAIGVAAQTAAMPTVQVVAFTKLENQLSAALAAGNREQAASMLTGDFEEWTPSGPPIGRDEWLNRGDHGRGRLRHMGVKDVGDHVLVSFVLTAHGKVFFLVDLWQRESAGWKLQQRFRSAVEKSTDGKRPALPPRKQ